VNSAVEDTSPKLEKVTTNPEEMTLKECNKLNALTADLEEMDTDLAIFQDVDAVPAVQVNSEWVLTLVVSHIRMNHVMQLTMKVGIYTNNLVIVSFFSLCKLNMYYTLQIIT
jgi:hypothetical protein